MLKKECLKFIKSVLLLRSIPIFFRIFLNVVFEEIAYYRENEKRFFLHITLNRCWNLKDFTDQVLEKSAPHNVYHKR